MSSIASVPQGTVGLFRLTIYVAYLLYAFSWQLWMPLLTLPYISTATKKTKKKTKKPPKKQKGRGERRMREKSLNNKIYLIAMTDIWLNYKELKVLFCNECGIFLSYQMCCNVNRVGFFYARLQGKKDLTEENLSFAFISNLSQPLNSWAKLLLAV